MTTHPLNQRGCDLSVLPMASCVPLWRDESRVWTLRKSVDRVRSSASAPDTGTAVHLACRLRQHCAPTSMPAVADSGTARMAPLIKPLSSVESRYAARRADHFQEAVSSKGVRG